MSLRLLGDRLDAVARVCRDAIAIVDGQRRISYHELLLRADALAHELEARGIGPRDLVGIALPRSAELVIAVVGVVRSGAAYVPIDLNQPAMRRSFILSDAHPKLVVTEGTQIEGIPPGIDVLPLPQHMPEGIEQRRRPELEDPAYVIYTSGSTGQPKGVVVTQRNAARLFTITEPLFQFDESDVWTLFHSIGFDFSVWELWGALLHGCRLVVVPAPTARAADAFHALVVREEVTVLCQTPSAFRAFDVADAAAGRPPNRLRHIVFGGEALDPHSLKGWFESHGDDQPRLANMYGITETTVHVTYRRMLAMDAGGSGKSLIGAPLADLRIDLLGPDGRPVAAGEAGEIFVGGEGVSAGYLGRRELTAQRFLSDPRSGHPNARLYRSGDLARRMPDGDLEYLGRIDNQVKLRGFRIEPGEIEAVLCTAADVRDAVVTLRNNTSTAPQLIAYVVQDNKKSIEPASLREHVAQRLPEYMVPAAYVRIQHVPRTINDKANFAALPPPAAADYPGAGISTPVRGDTPLSSTESVVLGIMREVLRQADLGPDADFFEMGGDSLLATELMFRLDSETGRKLPAHILDAAFTARRLAAVLEKPSGLRGTYPAGVVGIRAGTTDRPLFCFPGLGCTALQIRTLTARLHTRRPIYAIEAHNLQVAPSVLESMERTAAAVIERMCDVQPVGPYAILGYSFGGNLAIEVARQLIADDQTVELAIILDAYAPGSLRIPSSLKKWAMHLRIIARKRARESYTYILPRIRRRLFQRFTNLLAVDPAPHLPKSERERQLAEISEQCMRAYDAHRPEVFSGRIVLISAIDRDDGKEVADPSGACGWNPICKGGVNVIPMACRHVDFFNEPHITLFARHVDDLLKAIDSKYTTGAYSDRRSQHPQAGPVAAAALGDRDGAS